MAYLLAGCQAALAAVFAVSTLGKVRSRAAWSAFVSSVRELRLVPPHAVVVVAAATAVLEGAVALLVVVPATAALALLLAGGLLTTFTAAILMTLHRRIRAVCRCFGGTAALPLGYRHVVRNGLLLVVVGLGGASLLPGPAAPELAGLVVAVAAGLLLATVLAFFDQMVELFAGPVAGSDE